MAKSATIGRFMIISNITLSTQAQNSTLSATIAFRGKPIQQAYITVNNSYKSFISADATAFLAAVLLPCMKTKENIYIDGSVSKKFLINANKIMTLIRKGTNDLSQISIRSKIVKEDKKESTNRGLFFTAGVDSFYTYLKHKKEKNAITYFILVQGFTIPSENEPFFTQVKKTVQKIAKDEGIKAIIIKTNIGAIVEERLAGNFSRRGAFAAIALFLRNGLNQVYIANAVKNSHLFPYNLQKEIETLWSTETFSLQSDGGEYDHFEKIINSISTSSLALNYLRVCPQNIIENYNCSRCYKCLITMIYLTCANALDKTQTFDKTLDLALVKKMYYDYPRRYNKLGEEVLKFLKKKKQNPALQEAIEYSLEKSRKFRIIKHIYQTLTNRDKTYNVTTFHQVILHINILYKFLFNRKLVK